jgi:hypothetical protein
MPGTLTESACFVNPTSQVGTGQVALTVNTTPAHPTNASNRMKTPGWLATGGGTSLACTLLLFVPRRRRRIQSLLVLAVAAALFMVTGCSSGVKTDPGTAKGTYAVVVTASSGTGTSQYQTTVNVPFTIQ